MMAVAMYLSGNLQAMSDITLSFKDGKALVPVFRLLFEGFQNKMTAMLVDLRQEFIKVCDEKDFEIGNENAYFEAASWKKI